MTTTTTTRTDEEYHGERESERALKGREKSWLVRDEQVKRGTEVRRPYIASVKPKLEDSDMIRRNA